MNFYIFREILILAIGIFLSIVSWRMIHMDTIYYILGIMTYVIMILFIGFYI